ncbi:MAG: OB-fold nucleic acid binding domain-containing protein, partial [Candidatus Saccharibacteria bacterium]
MINRTMISELNNMIGQEVLIMGWVHVRRDHGKLAFFEIRDASAVVQAVYFRGGDALDESINKLRTEFVVEMSGEVKARPEKMINPDHSTGKIEFEIKDLKIISEAETTPFEITENKSSISEEVRMRYRYLDLR